MAAAREGVAHLAAPGFRGTGHPSVLSPRPLFEVRGNERSSAHTGCLGPPLPLSLSHTIEPHFLPNGGSLVNAPAQLCPSGQRLVLPTNHLRTGLQ